MQSTSTMKSLLSVILAVALTLTVIPFVTAADAEAKTVTFGTYNGAPLVWDVLEEKDNGDLVLITQGSVGSMKYFDDTKAVLCDQTNNYSTSYINSFLNGSFYESAFTNAEKAKIKKSTVTYDYYNTTAKAKATGTLEANVIIPNAAMVETYSLSGTDTLLKYWLTDGAATNANAKTAKIVQYTPKTGVSAVKTSGTISACDCRAIITIEAVTTGKFEAVEGVTYMINGAAVEGYTSSDDVLFTVAVDDKYIADNLVVTLGNTTLTAVDGVYTIPAKSTDTVKASGLTLKPADFTAYDNAKAEAEKVDRDVYTEDSLAALDEALNADVSDYTTILDQDKVDAAAKAITDAIAALAYKLADFTAFNAAMEELNEIKTNAPQEIEGFAEPQKLYNLDALNADKLKYSIVITQTTNKYKKYTSYTIDKQAEVDAATAEINALCAEIKANAISSADTSKWTTAYGKITQLKDDLYRNAAEIKAAAEEIKKEYGDYSDQSVYYTIYEQVAINEATAMLEAELAKAKYIDADFTALDALIAKAETYREADFYTDTTPDDGVEDYPEGTLAWNSFVAALNNAKAIDRSTMTDVNSQDTINTDVAALESAMSKLEPHRRFTPFEEEFANPVKDFFTEIANTIGMINGILTTVAGVLPLLFVPVDDGGINLYSAIESLGVDQEILDILYKLGIRPEEPKEESKEEQGATA